MAPINKSTRLGVSKPVTRKRHASRSQALSSDSESDSDLPPQSTTSSLFRPKSTTSQAASTFFTHPQPTFTNGARAPDNKGDEEDDDSDLDVSDLATIATRVGHEVDVFAEALDQYKDALAREEQKRDAALRLVTSWKDHAVDQVKRLRKQGQAVRARETFGGTGQGQGSMFSFRGGEGETQKGVKGDKEVKRWQAEADTWALVRVVLKARYPSQTEVEERKERLESVGKVHKYSGQENVWQAFVLGDEVARERHLVLKWLEQAADAEEEAKDKDMWVNGWMETRERIKGAKRMRLGDDAEVEVRSGKEILVSNLDPDAPSRQKRALEKGDLVKDKEMWKACFYMLRKGKPWDEVSEWIAQRNQGWRAASLGVAGSKDVPVGSSGPASGALWRRMCLIAARTGTTDDFEAAVYGLLGGDLDSVKKVCRSWNDHIFAHYNSLLMGQFDSFILQFNVLQLPGDFARKHGLGGSNPATGPQGARELVASLNKLPALAKEMRTPFKLLQSSLVGNTFSDLCRNVGTAIAEAAWKDEPSAVIKPVHRSITEVKQGGLAEGVISDDPDALRVITHTLIVMRALDQSHFTNPSHDELDNVVAGYIQLLRVAGKRDMTPLYASLMAEDRCVASLAQVITDDEDARDRMDFIRLMKVYDIDAIAVINGQYIYQLDIVLASSPAPAKPLDILESTPEDLYPGKRIKLSGIDTEITPDEEGLITGLSVFYLIEGHWSVTFSALSSACAKLLSKGHFPAALTLTTQLQFEQLSLSKSPSLLARAVNVMNPDHAALVFNGGTPDHARKLQIMQREAQSYYDMTLLVRAVQSLLTWRKVEHEFATRVPRPASTPAKVRKAIEEVQGAVEPILHGVLGGARDEEEAQTFRKILELYVPDIIVGYISALCTAGHMVSREELLVAMEVATVVAGEEGNWIARAFRDAGRMGELVRVFAEASKILLKLGEVGKKRTERRRGKAAGRDLGIWEIYG
ncbi:hypothetical protein B9Z65_2129 [Elsinoe australis]|uniref:Nuclear pore complex protein n=1 Tax=Elsinoe australis TaxID=40998 RepID=A0A2P7YN42_9PEZI|nr:hypothetical protein B9Z65_2129 [Elsinoe australis]